MNENETNPRPADAAAEHTSSAERVESEQPTAAQPPVAPQATAHQSAAPQAAPHSEPPTVQQPAVPQSAPPAPQSAPPAGWQPPQPQSPWQQPQPPHQGYPGYQQQPGFQQPGFQQQPGYQQQQYAYPGGWPGGPAPQPGAEGAGPAWAHPVGVAEPARPGRSRKIFVAGAAALVLALGAGGIGAATALALDDDGVRTVQSSNSSVNRVVDRSSLAQIVASVKDSVVSITTGSGEGSGVVLSEDGFIVTNNHVVASAQGASVNVIFADGKKATASIVGTDPRTDLAVIKASGVTGLSPAKFGDDSKMQVGDTVLALGSPLGLEGSVTQGIISAKDRTIRAGGEDGGQSNPFGNQQQQQGATSMSGLLQTDAPINPGNSGGALVNTSGEVIGINSAIATQGSGSGNIGLGFAIPSNKAKKVADDLMAGKKVSHPALGVSVADAENGGALVSGVTENSAAAKAGLQRGDVITQFDGQAIGDSDDLVAAVQGGSVGQKVTISYTRDGAKQTATATLAEAS